MTLRFSGFGIRANAGMPDEPLGIGAGAGWAGFGRARQGWANATAAVASRWVRSVWGSFGGVEPVSDPRAVPRTNAPRGAGSSAKAATARLTAIISAWSAMKRTKVACAISDQMILTGSRRTPQP